MARYGHSQNVNAYSTNEGKLSATHFLTYLLNGDSGPEFRAKGIGWRGALVRADLNPGVVKAEDGGLRQR